MPLRPRLVLRGTWSRNSSRHVLQPLQRLGLVFAPESRAPALGHVANASSLLPSNPATRHVGVVNRRGHEVTAVKILSIV